MMIGYLPGKLTGLGVFLFLLLARLQTVVDLQCFHDGKGDRSLKNAPIQVFFPAWLQCVVFFFSVLLIPVDG